MEWIESGLLLAGRLVGKPPGWERVVRALAPPARFSGCNLYVRRMGDGLVFPVDRGTLIGWSVHFFGTYEAEIRRQIHALLRPGAVAIDVGANVGWHTLLMAAMVTPTGRVYAFEPNPTIRERLAAALRANSLTHVDVDPRALSHYEGRSSFVAPAAGSVWDGTGHLLGDPSDTAVCVECTTLDAFAKAQGFQRLDLIKIDVEGWELSVLRGGREALESLRPFILFEHDPRYVSRSGSTGRTIVRFFRDLDYLVYSLPRRGRVMCAVTDLDVDGNYLASPSQDQGR